MGRLSNENKINLLRIEKQRILLSQELQSGYINDKDIYSLILQKTDFMFEKEKNTCKDIFLKRIYKMPFILCDQPYLSKSIKQLLPHILNVRYNIELGELNYLYENCFITPLEYEKQKDMLEFCYYKSSKEGKKIFNEQVKVK